jgi:hypothetical protein
VARFLFLLCLLFITPARAAVELDGVVIDPQDRIRPILLSQALNAWSVTPDARKDVLAIVDFAKPSEQPRFYIVDLTSGAVEAHRTAHGQGSDRGHDGIAEHFSNDDGSHASSLGAYRTAKRYFGQHGLSLALDGLDKTNSNARARLIVLHSADYMEASFIARNRRPGRSWGCFVVEPGVVDDVVERLENGALLYAGR